MGYAGGTRENPTYRKMGDHTESLQVDYDPTRVTYAELLEYAWNSHNPFRQPYSRQYMNLIFVHSQKQEKLAQESKARVEQELERAVKTKIIPFSGFYLAENYHQKYYLQNTPRLMDEFREIYPLFQDFVDSTAAARINGYLAGHGNPDSLSPELDYLGLSPEGSDYLLERVR